MNARMAAFSCADAAMHAAAELFVCEFGEPPLYEVQPRPVGGREVDVEPRALGQPVSDQRRLVRAVVVHDQVDVEVPRHGGVDGVEELTELGRRCR